MYGDDDFLEGPGAPPLGPLYDPPISTLLTELLAACSPPPAELVAEVERLIEGASREECEAFRYAAAEALKTSGAANSIMSSCGEWAASVVLEGRYTREHAAHAMMGGMMASAFQLGLLAATAAMLKRRVS
jgi:hypothetical protein